MFVPSESFFPPIFLYSTMFWFNTFHVKSRFSLINVSEIMMFKLMFTHSSYVPPPTMRAFILILIL